MIGELNQIFFEDLGIRKPDIFLNSASEKVGETIGNVISSIDRVFDKKNFDAFVILEILVV